MDLAPIIEYILSQVPKDFNGKANWLGVKMSPHTPMTFINKITATHVYTNEGKYPWEQCSNKVILTIYQRLKLNEAAINDAGRKTG